MAHSLNPEDVLKFVHCLKYILSGVSTILFPNTIYVKGGKNLIKLNANPDKLTYDLFCPETSCRSPGDKHRSSWFPNSHLQGKALPDLGSASQMALAALCQPWIRFLHYDISMFLEYCFPTIFHETQDQTGRERRPDKMGQQRNSIENEYRSVSYHEGTTNLRRNKKRFIHPSQVSQLAGGPQYDATAPLEMLQHREVYKVYRKTVQNTEEPELLKALELLHALTDAKGDRRLLDLVQKTLELDSFQKPFAKGLGKRIENELSKGRISRPCLGETISFLGGLLAESFGKFWSEMAGRLKDYGVEETGNEGWIRLKPILKVISTKIIITRLHGRKNNNCHPVKTQPSEEDKATFNRAIQVASQGWPTPEVLHFLRHLQTYGPQEDLPLLENNLFCCLEVQKFRNVHHAMPDRVLLKKKVKVIKEKFLFPLTNPVLQLSSEILQKSLQDTESAEQSEIPSLAVFNHLQDSLCDSLLPFWAGFRKAWQIRSPASAQRLPLLRVQQMLRKRLALFEMEEPSVKTFHLPPIQHSSESKFPSTVTFSFSISQGITIKENSEQDRDTQTPMAREDGTISQIGQLPPLIRTSPNRLPVDRT
ncbi:uncharacterized protein LOC134587620 isoform X1 [Pelobates fuscus]|uniref:uncharacterized protein LOC134587620 isoform X1 n=2 Tax=Pelobates fuscus TaxID=191477 RepID=UPI002FE4AE74